MSAHVIIIVMKTLAFLREKKITLTLFKKTPSYGEGFVISNVLIKGKCRVGYCPNL